MPSKQRGPAYVLGVGMTKFIKPRGKVDYTELGFEAGVKALLDAQINYDDVDQGVLLLLRRQHLRPARLLPIRHDPDPHLQRQQQLLHRQHWSGYGEDAGR